MVLIRGALERLGHVADERQGRRVVVLAHAARLPAARARDAVISLSAP
jgi:hypothetical protein